ncbi:MAG TPA: hypothetical protein VIF34_07835 [Methylocystis sp.]|jgi:hypothetical protein
MAKRLALIASGYALSIAVGVAAVAVNEFLMPADIADSSGGMVAFGDMVLFVLTAGFFSVAPTLFLLKLLAEKAPLALLAGLLLIAGLGPLSWLAMIRLYASGPNPPQIGPLLGLLIAFGAIPRIVAGPILVVFEGLAYSLAADGATRRPLLAAAMLMDLVPLSIYAVHMSGAP